MHERFWDLRKTIFVEGGRPQWESSRVGESRETEECYLKRILRVCYFIATALTWR